MFGSFEVTVLWGFIPLFEMSGVGSFKATFLRFVDIDTINHSTNVRYKIESFRKKCSDIFESKTKPALHPSLNLLRVTMHIH